MKIGLVLSGGGGKGAYELGVWKALGELDLHKHIEVISGTSIGALNAVLFAQDEPEKASGLWDEVTMDKVIPLSKLQLVTKGVALAIGSKAINFTKKHMKNRWDSVHGASKEGILGMIDKYLDMDKLKSTGRTCYATCTELPDFKARYFKLNDYTNKEVKEILMASATLPIIYKSTDVKGKKYFDGGIVDNTPVRPAYDEGCDFIIVVMLASDDRLDRHLYPNTNIIEIGPKEDHEGMIKGTLNLDAEAKKKRIKHGYDDAVALLKPIFDMAKQTYSMDMKQKHPNLTKFANFLDKFGKKHEHEHEYGNID